jgi:hypothetical protein
MAERQTNIAQTIDVAADLARYDECAKKLLSYDVIVAWILKSCTKEFSQYSVQFIMDNCLREKPEISRRAVHQDQPDYDLMEVVVLNLGDASQKNNREILDLLNVLFSATTPPEEKKKILKNDFHIAMTEEFESEVQRMCDLSKGVYNEGVRQGEDLFAQLITKLFSLGRAGDAERAASDKEYRRKLMEEFQITK